MAWSSNGVEWAGSEDASSLEYSEHNVRNLAIEVVGQHWTSEVISLLLEEWEVGRVALSFHLSLDFLCQEMRMCVRGAQSRWVPLVHCVQSARKEGRGVLMPGFRLSMRGLACSLVTVLNILCLLRNEGFPSFCLCASSSLCIVQKVGRRLCHHSTA